MHSVLLPHYNLLHTQERREISAIQLQRIQWEGLNLGLASIFSISDKEFLICHVLHTWHISVESKQMCGYKGQIIKEVIICHSIIM